MKAAPVLALAALLSSSCVVGAPPGFGDGDVWTLPMVAPLEDDVLLVPVSINDTGPYLFMIDPDSHVSSIDNAIVDDLELYTVGGPEELTEADTRVPTFIAEVPKMESGNLVVKNHKWRIHKLGTYWVGGRRVRGVLGRDIVADSLIFHVDRDLGIVQIAEQGKLSAPANAAKLSYRNFFGRHLAKVTINDSKTMTMHIDLGGRQSRLWSKKIRDANLPQVRISGKLVDEYGTVQNVTGGGIAAKVTAAGQDVQGLLIVPFGDRRVDDEDMDGSLGQDFLSRFVVTANWHKKSVWLSPRGKAADVTADRLNRWRAIMGPCTATGCVVATLGHATGGPGGFTPTTRAPGPRPDPTLLADPGAGAPDPGADSKLDPNMPAKPAPDDGAKPNPNATPGGGAPVPPPPTMPRFRVERDPASSELVTKQRLEVLLDAVDVSGKSLGMPKLLVTLRAGAARVEGQLDATYAGAKGLRVLDVSPLGRTCKAGEKCYWIQTRSL